MNDIFAYGRSIDYGADYYDFNTGYIYHLQDYGKALKENKNPEGIMVSYNNSIIGIVRPKN